jgi:alpha-beta hydrolase superfamily lysophospholipase
MKWRRRLVLLAIVIVLGWLGSAAAALALIRARRLPPHDEPVPAALVSQVEVVRLTTSDGADIGAWFLDSPQREAPTVVQLHGLGGKRVVRLGAADVVRERGCAVLLVTLRCHGDSSGEREDFGWSARHDVIAAVDWVRAKRPGRQVFVHGASLGAAAAVFAAEELGSKVEGYAFECLYRDLETAAYTRCASMLPAGLDYVAWSGLRVVARVMWPEFADIAPVEAIARVPRSASILLLAGGADVLAPREETDALFERVADRARLVVIDGATHDRLQTADPQRYRTAVLEWLDRR